MNRTYFLTIRGLIELQKQIDALFEEIEDLNRRMGISVEQDNDLRENPEYLALRTKAEYEVPDKIDKLSIVMQNYTLIEELGSIREDDCEIIDVGHEVNLADEEDNIRIINILGFNDSDPQNGIVSYLTPIAQKLLGLIEGEEVELPYQGKSIKYEVKKIKISPFIERHQSSKEK